jgi:hypothetical protein
MNAGDDGKMGRFVPVEELFKGHDRLQAVLLRSDALADDASSATDVMAKVTASRVGSGEESFALTALAGSTVGLVDQKSDGLVPPSPVDCFRLTSIRKHH